MHPNSCLFLGPLVKIKLFSFSMSGQIVLPFQSFLVLHVFDRIFFNKSECVLGISATTAGLELKVKLKEQCVLLP